MKEVNFGGEPSEISALQEVDEAPVPGYQNYYVYTDESGFHGSRYFGFGSLWTPFERRGNLAGTVAKLREEHGYHDELKWNRQSRRSLPFARDLVDWFFNTRSLMFHCILVNVSKVDMTLHQSREEAQQKYLGLLLSDKIGRVATGGGKRYRIRADSFSWRYAKSDEKILHILNSRLKKKLREPVVHDILQRDSKDTPGIQLADFFLGAVLSCWQGETSARHKLEITRHIAEHLGWDELRHDTRPAEWKFNIWHFHDPRSSVF